MLAPTASYFLTQNRLQSLDFRLQHLQLSFKSNKQKIGKKKKKTRPTYSRKTPTHQWELHFHQLSINFYVHPDLWEKNPSCLRAHILYNFLPGWFNFNHQLLKTVALLAPSSEPVRFSKPTKVEGKLTFLRTEFGSLHLGRFSRKKNRQFLDGEFCWGICQLDFSDRGICYGKKGGQPCFFRGFRSFTCLNSRYSSQFFFFFTRYACGWKASIGDKGKKLRETYYFFLRCT